MTHYTFPIAIEREDGQYYAYSEDLPGVYGLGETIEAAKESMLEGIRLYVLECKRDGRAVPSPRTIYTETVSIAFEE
jgi:predicted RNase H-like HicB family nuclease